MSWTGRRILMLGAAAWLVITVATWPGALSFGDEVGYVGQARMLLHGRLRPDADDVAVRVPAPGGPVAKYPPAYSAVLAPFVALWPPAVFAVSMGSLLLLVWLAALILESWGRRPWWALLFFVHPTFVILARTTMADVPLSAAALGAWFAHRRGRAGLVAVLCALAVLCKPTGAFIAAGLGIGALLERWLAKRSAKEALAAALPAALGGACGLGLALVLNRVANGTFVYAYVGALRGVAHPWSLRHVAHAGADRMIALLLLPPGLVLGFIPLLKRRDLAAATTVAVYVVALSMYYFVDEGRTWAESLVLWPRLVLPAAAILLVGYGALLDGLLDAVVARRLAVPVLLGLVVVVAGAVSVKHERWLEPMARARVAAERAADRVGSRRLGSDGAAKAALLSRLEPVDAMKRADRPAVVLCATRYRSRRAPGGARSCDLPGYRQATAVDDYRVLVRTKNVVGQGTAAGRSPLGERGSTE